MSTDFEQWKSFLTRHCEFAQQKPDLCEKYSKTLSENDITLSMLNDLTHELLKEMDISVIGHRLAILKAAKAAAAEASAATSVAAERNDSARASTETAKSVPESPLASSSEQSLSNSATSEVGAPPTTSAAVAAKAAHLPVAPTSAAAATSTSPVAPHQHHQHNHTAQQQQHAHAAERKSSSGSTTTAAAALASSGGRHARPASATRNGSEHLDEPPHIDENETLMKAGVEFRKDFGAYEISSNEIATFELIGRGGHADVFRGRCRGQEVAVKVLQAQNIPENVRREFMSEVLFRAFVFFR